MDIDICRIVLLMRKEFQMIVLIILYGIFYLWNNDKIDFISSLYWVRNILLCSELYRKLANVDQRFNI